MINWLWVIPWIAIIMFAAGWFLGSRWQLKRTNEKWYQERDFDDYRRGINREVDSLRDHIYRVESRVESNLYASMKSASRPAETEGVF